MSSEEKFFILKKNDNDYDLKTSKSYNSLKEAREEAKKNQKDYSCIVKVVEVIERTKEEKQTERIKRAVSKLRQFVKDEDSIYTMKKTSFAKGLIDFYERKGYLTIRQLICAESIDKNTGSFGYSKSASYSDIEPDTAYTSDFGWMGNSVCE